MRVLALDPGERVGWAYANINPKTGAWEDFAHGILELKPCAMEVYGMCRNGDSWADIPVGGVDLIVMEEWALYANKANEMIGSTFPSVQFIGMVKLSAWLGGVPVIMQGARKQNQARKSMPPRHPDLWKLVEAGERRAHDDSHDMSAILHLWAWTFDHTNLEAYL